MGKIKSAILLTLITLLIAVLCVLCFVPFPVAWNEEGDALEFFNPIVNWSQKSADFGGFQFGGETPEYVGGGYSVVLYPEGVISRKEYEDNTKGRSEEDIEEYTGKYVAYADGAIYLDKEEVCGGGTTPTTDFIEAFENRVKILTARFERLEQQNLSLSRCNDYTVRAFLPSTSSATVAAFQYFSYMGDVSVRYGSSASSATILFPLTGSGAKPIGDYIKRVSTRSAQRNYYVSIDLTPLGREELRSATSSATEDSTDAIYFMVGEEQVLSYGPVTGVVDVPSLTLGSETSPYSKEAATVISAVLDTAIEYKSDFEMKMSMGEIYRVTAAFGDSALIFFYIAFAICFAGMCVYFFIRYRRLAFAHILSYLIFLLAAVLSFWATPIAWGVGTITAFALASVLLCVSDCIAYEYVKKEYATGKTMDSSVKEGYKKSFWVVFDLHIVLLILALLVYLIALTELQAFGLALLFCVAFSGLCSLAVNRFLWYITMPFAKNAGAFCNFKRTEVEDDD